MLEGLNGEGRNDLFDIGVRSMEETNWKTLLRQIRRGTCIPFIGPEICEPVYSKAHIAQTWADEEGYPFEDRSDLARVSQFLAVQNAPAYPVDKLIEELDGLNPPAPTDRNEPHRVLAALPLPIYITTNYDNFMRRTLEGLTMPRDARSSFCRWREPPSQSDAIEEDALTPSRPLVFHLFGHTEEPASLVLTEYDYLKFLVNVSKEPALIPSLLRGRISSGSLMFIGYQFNDWDFRILIHTIANYLTLSQLGNAHVSVVTPHMQQEAAVYLRLYFRNLDLRVYRGTPEAFLIELRDRWEALANG